MKPKIFKIAIIAFMLTIAFMKSHAQQAQGTPPVPTKAEPPLPPMAVAGIMPDDTVPKKKRIPVARMSIGVGQTSLAGDSDYRKKMNDLNAQMNDLRKQMSDLRTQELKKQQAAMREANEKMLKQMNDNNDKSFNRAFAAPRVAFNYDDSDERLKEKIKSGDVKELIKAYSKSYSVGKNDLLSIDNSYGKVTVNTWAKNEFKVDVEIKADADAQDEAQKMLDDVTISDTKEGDNVLFKTSFAEKNHHWYTNYNSDDGKYSIHRIQVNYTIYLPSKSSLSITNHYGATAMTDFEGKLTIDNSYGSFTAKRLTNPANAITTRYGSTAIESLNGSDVKVSYGSLDLGSCDNLNAEISYSPAKIAVLKSSGNISLHYGGGLKIGTLDKGLKSLAVNANYSNVNLSLGGDPNFNFDVSVRYGGFNYSNGVSVTEKTPDDSQRGWVSTKSYKGLIGKGSTDKIISIKSNYGNVNFN
jgi:hypothetical protein